MASDDCADRYVYQLKSTRVHQHSMNGLTVELVDPGIVVRDGPT